MSRAQAQYTICAVSDGANGKSAYLHVRYSDDGESFTADKGRELGAWIGTLVDDKPADSEVFSDYTWRRFADDTELLGKIDAVQENVDRVVETLRESYVARSDFGEYQETINTTIEATARAVVESYEFAAMLRAVNSRFDAADETLTAIRGEIRRGLITDPETGETAMGIAISEDLSFTGAERTENGLTYYELSPGQTLGLYTATGWQFWINGSKRGWFDSVDGMLHVSNLAVENSLRLGGGWVVTMADGFGLRYLG